VCTFIVYNSRIPAARRRAESFLRRRAKDFISFRETICGQTKRHIFLYSRQYHNMYV